MLAAVPVEVVETVNKSFAIEKAANEGLLIVHLEVSGSVYAFFPVPMVTLLVKSSKKSKVESPFATVVVADVLP